MRLRIGELASAVGVSPHTIRYYEKLNLLPRAIRTFGGYRLYTEEDVKRLRFIKQAQTIGFSLSEIKQVLLSGEAGLEECQRIHELLNSKLCQIDQWLTEMRAFREAVAANLGECKETLGGQRGGDCCPVLFDLTQATNVVEEPELISVLKSNKGGRKTRKEDAVTVEVRDERSSRQRSVGNCCEPLLHGPGLVRTQLAEGLRRSSHH